VRGDENLEDLLGIDVVSDSLESEVFELVAVAAKEKRKKKVKETSER